MADRKRIIVYRGEIAFSNENILQTNISTCVTICLYYEKLKVGGITHISRSHQNKSEASKRYFRHDGYYYADTSIQKLLRFFNRQCGLKNEKELKLVIAGGLKNEGPIKETLSELEKYNFTHILSDINKNYYRKILFDPALGKIEITKRMNVLDLEKKKTTTRIISLI